MDILIVEDSVRERERLQTMFTELGYQVSSCDSVSEAEKLFQKETIKCAVLDIGLTDRSGSVLFQSLKSAQPDCQVIIFTGNPSPYLKQRFLREGALAYVVKGSEAASNESFQRLVVSAIGDADAQTPIEAQGRPLEEFLRLFIPAQSQSLFFDTDGGFPPCGECGSREYLVTFSHEIQIPPFVKGKVYCSECGVQLDPTLSDGEE
ncbi:MAG: response regulator [Bdellovibrionales bacterium]|nr:response regulator [Bdellovibrionales bacterium]